MIPDYIRSSEASSFGYYTICNRFPKIVNDIMRHNTLGTAYRRLASFNNEISTLKINKLTTEHPSVALFNASIGPFKGQGIFEVPFFTAELFFYQLLAEKLGYHTNKHDYFSALKQRGLADAIQLITGESGMLFPQNWNMITSEDIIRSLHVALWGNLADLSLFSRSNPPYDSSFSNNRILIDHSFAFIDFFKSYEGTVHVFLDNVGYELVSDLYLIAVLLSANRHCKIKAHVKPIPMFVSDSTLADWELTLAAIGDLKEAPIRSWYSLLTAALADHRISLTTDHFWSSAYHFSDHWLNQLKISADELILCKGDLNYRRFFEDRSWPASTPTEAAIATSTAPTLFLRTLKSEIMTGLSPSTIQDLDTTNPDWMITGRYGIIQFVTR